MKKKSKVIRQQLDSTLKKFRLLLYVSAPHKGWIRAIRDALGMSGRQLGDRVGVTKQRTAHIEKQELSGAVTINTMHKMAESLDCVFVYCLVPRISLEDTVRRQAKQFAAKRLARVSQTMNLEAQSLTAKENEKVLVEMTEEFINKYPSGLWDN
ncbi:mobile mystery protein A [bacterium]|nr:mobile mystery protein A [bacterium]